MDLWQSRSDRPVDPTISFVWVPGQGFVEAGSLGIGTEIVTRAGPALAVLSVQWHLGTDGQDLGEEVYNFTVDGDHTYFVGTLYGGAWVHNTSFSLQQLANEVFAAGGKRPDQQTIIAAQTADGRVVVGCNSGRSLLYRRYLNKKQRDIIAEYGAIYARGARYVGPGANGHAEQNVIGDYIEQRLGTKATFIACSNHVCPECALFIRSNGRKIFSFTPFAK